MSAANNDLSAAPSALSIGIDNEAATSENVITRALFRARSALRSSGASGAAGGGSSSMMGMASLAEEGRPASAMSSTHEDDVGGAPSQRAGQQQSQPLTLQQAAKKQPFGVRVEGHDIDEAKGAAPVLQAILRRDSYKSGDIDKGGKETRIPPGEEQAAMSKIELTMEDGIYCFDGMEAHPVDWAQYIGDLTTIFNLLEVGSWLSFCKTRLLAVHEKFEIFSLLNADLEEAFDAYSGGGGVFGRSVKVDNAVRLSTCATADVLVENIRRASRHRGSEVVHIDQHNRPITFSELCINELQIDASSVTAEGLGLHPPARKEPSKRYDCLDPDMNAAGDDGVELLSLFLECHGLNSGRFFADLVRPVLECRETNAVQAANTTAPQAVVNIAAEYKLPILGRRMDEWSVVARWICEHSMTQMTRAVFNIEIPRSEKKREDLYDCRTNEDQLRNIFYPMFMATLHPQDPELREVAVALCKVGAICISSDEKIRRTGFHKDVRPPGTKSWKNDVPDDYYFFYYVWANLFSLNALRRKLGLNTLQFRTICSEETPHWDHLVVSYLLADHVEHAGKLVDSWVLQYMYKMARIGIVMSPISSNGAGVSFFESAFPTLFKRGLLVSLGTGDPLHFHHNPEPLIEEYNTAQSHFDMSTADMAEIARNSVLISCFSNEAKSAWLGATYTLGVDGNDPAKSHVSDVRLNFRHECLMQEQTVLNLAVQSTASDKDKAKKTVFNSFRAAVHRVDEGPRNVLLTKLREMHRINSVDRRVALNRICIDGPLTDTHTVRPMANMLRSAITLRKQYRLALHAVAIPELAAVAVPAQSTAAVHGGHNVSNSGSDPGGVSWEDQKEQRGERGDTEGEDGGSSDEPGSNPLLSNNKKKKDHHTPQHISASFRFGDDTALERAFQVADDSFDPSQYSFNMYFGVCLIHLAGTSPEWPDYIPEFSTFMNDVAAIRQLVSESSALAEFCQQRLQLLEHKFQLHLALNIAKECGEVKDRELDNRDFYTCARVDNFLASEASMNPRVLFHYFTERARVGQNDVVFERNKHPVTLRQYLTEIGITDVDRLTVDELTNLLAQHQELRALFLSADNYMGGRYFAELTKSTLDQYKEDKYSFAETRLPIYGRSRSEWDVLASWCDRYGMVSAQSRWMARISRSYRRLRREGAVQNFGDYLDNIFMPLWEVSLNPAKHPRLHHFLTYVSGFDCEGNEQKVDMTLEHRPPHEWNSELNPPFNYYMYYLWANITALNAFRRQRGLNVFSFRPQAGESGSLDHLIGAFLVADGISHGVTLMQSPTLQYLFYITQLPVAMCPLSNTNVIPYLQHPFSHFFSRGLNVSLATNKPLFNHFTSEPLIEEYSLAAKIWKLQNGDLCELARNSVRMSDFGAAWKRKVLGPLYELNSVLGNDTQLSRMSDYRIAYRYETYHAELDYLDEVFAQEDMRGWIFTFASGAAGTGGTANFYTSPLTPAHSGLGSRPGFTSSFASAAAAALRDDVGGGSSATAAAGGDDQTMSLGIRRLSTMSTNSATNKQQQQQQQHRTPSRLTTQQLIAQAHTAREPFPRAMLSLETEVEVYQARKGIRVFIPWAVGEQQQQQQQEEEELSRAVVAAQIKQQVGELEREVSSRTVEIKRLEEERLRFATDIATTRRKVAAMTSVPSTKIEANLNG